MMKSKTETNSIWAQFVGDYEREVVRGQSTPAVTEAMRAVLSVLSRLLSEKTWVEGGASVQLSEHQTAYQVAQVEVTTKLRKLRRELLRERKRLFRINRVAGGWLWTVEERQSHQAKVNKVDQQIKWAENALQSYLR
jgi:hypothetical protein